MTVPAGKTSGLTFTHGFAGLASSAAAPAAPTSHAVIKISRHIIYLTFL
jgi:hypothetical protein